MFHCVGDTVGPAGICRVLRNVPVFRVYEILCVNGLLSLGESPLKQDGKSIERRLPLADRHGPLFGDIL